MGVKTTQKSKVETITMSGSEALVHCLALVDIAFERIEQGIAEIARFCVIQRRLARRRPPQCKVVVS